MGDEAVTKGAGVEGAVGGVVVFFCLKRSGLVVFVCFFVFFFCFF